MSNIYKYPYEAQQEINDLERQLEETRQDEMLFLNALLWGMSVNNVNYKAISRRVERLKEK